MQLLEELFPFVDTSGGGTGSMSGANAMAPTRDSSRYQHQLHHHHHQQQQQHHQQHQQQGVTPFQVACPLSEHMLARDLEQGWQEILEMPEMQALDVTAPAQHHHQHQQQQQHHHQQQHQQQAPPGAADASLYSESPDLVDGFCQQRARLPSQSFYPGGGGTTATGGTGASTGFCAAFSAGSAPPPPLRPEPQGFARAKLEYAATSASSGAGYKEISYFGSAQCVPRHAGAPSLHPLPPPSSAAASPAAGSGGSYQPLPVGPPGATFGSFGVCGGGGADGVGVAGCGGGGESREQPCAHRCLSRGTGLYPDSAAVLLPYADHLGCYGGGSSSNSSSGSGDGSKETYESFRTLGYEASADGECGGGEQMPCEMMYLDHHHQQHQQHDVHRGEPSTTPDYISFLGASALVDLSGSAGGVCIAASEGGGVCGAAGLTRVAGPLPPGGAAATAATTGPDRLHLDPLPPAAARRGGAASSLRLLPSGADARLSRDERRAAAMRIPIGVSQIVNMAVDDFNELLARHRLTEPQLALVRDIRRRGKNKVAAQNCRKRKLDGLTGLERELARLQGRREALLAERRDIEEGVAAAERRLAALRAQVFAALRDESGRPYPPERFCLRHTSDGAVCLVPSGGGGGTGDGDGQASGR
uniref:Uncharacterized protein LOC116954762 n=1 Tax=Petromyzon marinus TaxID=7757 RepID=A0AAJ7U946_PETMA|nr:uncharacterized protein LOC116954762 [Petromyzon marinus]